MSKIFNKDASSHLGQPLFFGEDMGIARYETVTHPVLENLVEKQLSFFWRADEIDIFKDANDFNKLMTPDEQYVFTQNLKYQIILDTVQGRAPSLCFLPIASDISMENWITTWTFSESIHSRSYTHIIRNVYTDPSSVFDEITLDKNIMERASSVSVYYDRLLNALDDFKIDPSDVTMHLAKKALYLCFHAVNALEAIRFYVSFACSFSFAERKLMEGNAKIIKLIARDEQLHLKSTQYTLKQFHNSDREGMKAIAEECREEATAIFLAAAEQEKAWARTLLKPEGRPEINIPGLSLTEMIDYIDYLVASRMRSVDLVYTGNTPVQHPLPWIRKWLNSDSVQVAAQEAELSSYLVGQIDSNLRPQVLKTIRV